MQPFRFGIMGGRATSRAEWLDQVRQAESLGYSTVFISDHFSDKLAPLPALAVAAEHTSMRVGTLVLANDFRHPAVVAKEAATVDLLSGGRLELGIGTGWEESDYASAGIERHPPGTQVDRLEEALAVMRGLWSAGKLAFDGEHYQVDLDGRPKPGEGRPTLIVGGGGRRMLGIAGREADIVGISAAQLTDRNDARERFPRAGEGMDQKIDWIRAGAGERFPRLELNVLVFGLRVGDRERMAAALAEEWGSPTSAILSSPHFLAGTVAQIAADLRERRRRWGISYVVVQAESMTDFSPVVEELAGT